MEETIFECKCCDATTHGEASPDGPRKAGWYTLIGIDGPNSVCPACRAGGDEVLEHMREDYPDVRFADRE